MANPQPLTSFGKNSWNKDKLQNQCKTCYDAKYVGYKAKYYRDNPEKKAAYLVRCYVYQAKYRANNVEKVKAIKIQHRVDHPEKYTYSTNKRRAAKLHATPPWITAEQLEEIKWFYITAKELQWLSDPTDPFEVDHIVPLQGENVCGLHVPWNLQILPMSLNCSKGNRMK